MSCCWHAQFTAHHIQEFDPSHPHFRMDEQTLQGTTVATEVCTHENMFISERID